MSHDETEEMLPEVLLPYLSEILAALEILIARGEETTIDLHNLPLLPEQKIAFINFLGKGEITVEMDSLGKSLIYETQFSGVWLVDHYNPEGKRIAYHLTVTFVPAIIKSQLTEISVSKERLAAELSRHHHG